MTPDASGSQGGPQGVRGRRRSLAGRR